MLRDHGRRPVNSWPLPESCSGCEALNIRRARRATGGAVPACYRDAPGMRQRISDGIRLREEIVNCQRRTRHDATSTPLAPGFAGRGRRRCCAAVGRAPCRERSSPAPPLLPVPPLGPVHRVTVAARPAPARAQCSARLGSDRRGAGLGAGPFRSGAATGWRPVAVRWPGRGAPDTRGSDPFRCGIDHARVSARRTVVSGGSARRSVPEWPPGTGPGRLISGAARGDRQSGGARWVSRGVRGGASGTVRGAVGRGVRGGSGTPRPAPGAPPEMG